MGKLDGRTVVITGAARGIGRGVAMRLGAEGANVGVADLDAEGAEATAAALREAGGAAIGVGCDVGDRDSVKAALDAAVDEFGRLDVLFNNAGISKTQHFLEVTEEDYNRIMRVNGLGVLFGTQEAAKIYRSQGGGGKVVNTASIAGKEGFPLFPAYCASKFAVVSMTQSAARDLSGEGITVNAFCPGVVTTELWDQLDEDSRNVGETETEGQLLDEFSENIPVGRTSTPEDIAGLCVFLASADSDYITGQSINVDGGMLVH
ncbi:MAG TPA: glucose 1-dehydrogenase [Solirubrobacterales bacterium]|jgi:meso-butanediol dehydrogenase/(S,S)-butanediol dehydrogenase/diacetyl reductase|nr:glucose 1-dehydrogenase [Solirubrobacterales bacterium]